MPSTARCTLIPPLNVHPPLSHPIRTHCCLHLILSRQGAPVIESVVVKTWETQWKHISIQTFNQEPGPGFGPAVHALGHGWVTGQVGRGGPIGGNMPAWLQTYLDTGWPDGDLIVTGSASILDYFLWVTSYRSRFAPYYCVWATSYLIWSQQ